MFLIDAFKIYMLNLMDAEKDLMDAEKVSSREGHLVANWAQI